MTADEIVLNKVGGFPTENQKIFVAPAKFRYFRQTGAN